MDVPVTPEAVSGTVEVVVRDFVATITIDRPPVNAVGRSTLLAIGEAFRSLNDRRDVRVAIFTGAGARAFIGGADLTSYGVTNSDEMPTELTDLGLVAREALWSVTDCAVPVIAAVNGPAMGAGLAFAACCDIIVAAAGATFGAPEINVGLLGASSHLSLMVGRHKAREMFFLGEKVSAEELHRLGAIRTVVPGEELLNVARCIAEQLAEKSPIALRLAKESMNRVEFMPLKDAYRTEQDYTNRLLGFADSAEARTAYLEKRKPEWRWR
ncbi:enoyl-CoA hydratase-related protein [Mycolicibacter kumamotonensis]|uniref:Enoyl-CoA hydratase n=1 Tax=Mycolicibacter kumamotonensis TaxID=354243 RepID=A0A7K3LJI2_9MYCO|nr:enoyl-CoA hydratase-related protein [Mycolicibacter kumamotonensis]NDJ91796.1 enoyl-CoA hydratase [Mycolicibacter kumamotonensis]